MISFEQLEEIVEKTASKIVFLVIDGLGGLPHPDTGKTELETAKIPNLDKLASEGICGLADTVAPGVTPGSAPGHLGLFGYDPLQFIIGRGVLETLGVDFDLQKNDVAARGNFCTVNQDGIIIDRRAGRIATEKCAELCKTLSEIELDGIQLFVLPAREHRFVVVFRGNGISDKLTDSDPQRVGVPPKNVVSLSADAERSGQLVNEFISKARDLLKNSHLANMILLRGFSSYPSLSTMSEIYKLNPAAIAVYPMYRGLAKLVGMKVLNSGATLEDELDTLARHFADHDFFYFHVKWTDSAGEDGDFERKVRILEEVDAAVVRLKNLNPDVIVVTGDHSTPAVLKSHSWHPVPVLLHSKWCCPDEVQEFSERSCARGSLGRFRAINIMPLALAHALKLRKFGA